MVRLFTIVILRNDVTPAALLASAQDLSTFGFFQRSSVGEFMTFFAKTVAERTQAGQRQDVEENNYVGHVYARTEGLCGVVISDKEYPLRVAFSLLSKVLDEFLQKYPLSKVKSANGLLDFPELHGYLTRFQDPSQADTIMRVQQELDETKVVLHKTIESVLQRGEKLDQLVERSDALNAQSKLFYKTAKKQNSCCTVM